MIPRGERMLLPAAVGAVSTSVTLWLVAGLDVGPAYWFRRFTAAESTATILLAIGAGGLGIGYLAHAVFSAIMFINPATRNVNLDMLAKAFSVKITCKKRAVRQEIQRCLLGEFHTRWHSHAPKLLIDHGSRRNSAWYIAKTSAITSALGWGVAFAFMSAFKGQLIVLPWALCPVQTAGLCIAFLVFVIFLPVILWVEGTKWNEEYWEVCWRWLFWDRSVHGLPKEWYETLPEGLERM